MWLASLLESLESSCQRVQSSRRRPEAECLEDRTLLTVQFTPGPYLTPANRPDVPLGTMANVPFVEPMLAVNKSAPGNIAVSSHFGVRITTNAGATFTGPTTFKLPSGYNVFEGDTDLKFDSQGRLFWSNLAGSSSTGTSVVSVSQINPTTGANITSARVSSGPADDKPFLAIDTNPGSPFFNNLYVVWTEYNSTPQVFFSRSTNQAVTWSSPLRLSNGPVDGAVPFSDVSVAPNGDVYVAYHSQLLFFAGGNPDGTTGKTFVLRSTNGGVSFTQKDLAFGPGQSDITYNMQTDVRAIPGTQFVTAGSAQPRMLADPVRPENVYVVTADDPTNGAGAPYSRTVLARSTDNGATWSFPQPNGSIAPLDGPSFQLFPTASIDPFGDIVVAWYDNRRGLTNSRGRFFLDVFATYSTDGGLTWATPFQVNDLSNPFDPDPNAPAYNSGPPPTTRIGEYFGSAVFGDTAYLAWNANTFSGRTPVGQQVWFSSFALSGALTVTGTSGSDSIIIRSMSGNTDFMEVLVDGQRQYVGLGSGLTGITVAATDGNDTINLEGTPADMPVTINLGNGTDTVNLSPVAQNLSNLAGTVTINGGTGSDTLTLFDAGINTNQNYTVAGTSVDRPGMATVTYQSVSNLVLNTSNGTDTITVQSTAAGTAVAVNGGHGTNTLVGSAVDNTWVLSGTNAGTLSSASIGGLVTFSSVQDLTGGPANNTFAFGDGARISGNLDGGAGGSLDYSAYSSSVIVDLQTATATGVGGSIAHIQNVAGGNGGGAGVYNILVGNGGNILIGGNGRRNLLIAGSSASTLIGGDDEDILIGGTTAYDLDVVSLMAIMDYWTGTDDYDMQVFNLTHGIGVPLLDATTVSGNEGGNSLTGGPGRDLFYGNLALDLYDWDPLMETFIGV